MTCRRSPCTFSSRVIGRSSQSGPLQGVVTLGTIGQMALTVARHKCQHYSDSVQARLAHDCKHAPLGRHTLERRLPANVSGHGAYLAGALEAEGCPSLGWGHSSPSSYWRSI